jgi:Aspartyl protease
MISIEPLNQLIAAINENSIGLLTPYLTADTCFGALPAAYTLQVLAQIIPQFGPVHHVRLVRQEAVGANTRYVCAMTREGQEREYDFLLTPAGKFLEINLAQAYAKEIDTAFGPEELVTPPWVDVPVKLVQGLMLVEAEVDGRQGTFVLDSGAPALMLNTEHFQSPNAQLRTITTGPRGVNGSIGGMSYHAVRRFEWAGIRFANKEVPMLDLAVIEQKVGATPLLGLIGYNLLSGYALTLDYKAFRIHLSRPGNGPLASPLLSVPFTLRGHLPVVEVAAQGRSFHLALDCGAQSNLLADCYEPLFADALRERTDVVLQGADGLPRTVTSGCVPDLHLAGALVLLNQQTVFADIGHLNQRPGQIELHGIAGYPFLSQYRTTIDFAAEQVHFFNW